MVQQAMQKEQGESTGLLSQTFECEPEVLCAQHRLICVGGKGKSASLDMFRAICICDPPLSMPAQSSQHLLFEA